jgi:hypothetical protein
MIRMESKTVTIETPALTGCPSFLIELREVFPDQIDRLGDDCEYCQTEGQQVLVNLYLPYQHGTPEGHAAVLHTCIPCIGIVVLDRSVGLDCDRVIVAEWAQVRK